MASSTSYIDSSGQPVNPKDTISVCHKKPFHHVDVANITQMKEEKILQDPVELELKAYPKH